MLNDIGLFVKSNKNEPEWRSGFEIQFGGNNNVTSRIIRQGRDVFVMKRQNTIQAGHKYHFHISYRDGIMHYLVVDTTTNTTIINKMAIVPDINIVKEDQRQGFWTWGSQIYIDNITISTLRRTYLDVAKDFQGVFGTSEAVKFLVEQMSKRRTSEGRKECFNAALKLCLNASIKEKESLSCMVAALYVRTFGDISPSKIVEQELLSGFYRLCLSLKDIPDVDKAKLRKVVTEDPAFSGYSDLLEKKR